MVRTLSNRVKEQRDYKRMFIRSLISENYVLAKKLSRRLEPTSVVYRCSYHLESLVNRNLVRKAEHVARMFGKDVLAYFNIIKSRRRAQA